MQVDVARIWDTLLARQLVPESCQASFLVGSAANGWGNDKSDLDICVVSTEPWAGPDCIETSVLLEPPVVHWHTFHSDNRDWDLSYWVDTQFDQLLAKLAWSSYDQDRANSGDVLPTREEVLLGRLATCRPLFGEDWVLRRRAELEASAFRPILVARSLGEADRAIEDSIGQLEDGDLNSAVLSARQALGYTVDALLEEQGQFGSHLVKWRSRRFRAANPRALSFDKYWELETMQGFDPTDPARWINAVLTLCQDLSFKIEV